MGKSCGRSRENGECREFHIENPRKGVNRDYTPSVGRATGLGSAADFAWRRGADRPNQGGWGGGRRGVPAARPAVGRGVVSGRLTSSPPCPISSSPRWAGL